MINYYSVTEIKYVTNTKISSQLSRHMISVTVDTWLLPTYNKLLLTSTLYLMMINFMTYLRSKELGLVSVLYCNRTFKHIKSPSNIHHCIQMSQPKVQDCSLLIFISWICVKIQNTNDIQTCVILLLVDHWFL